MKSNNQDFSSDDDVAQRLFSTPDKNRVNEWRLPTSAEDYTRRLFDSSKKNGKTKKNIILVMPFFDEQTQKVSSEGILSSILEMINE